MALVQEILGNVKKSATGEYIMSSKPEENTVPATIENLRLESDYTPFDTEARELSAPHAVIIDGIRGEACVGTLGTYSERISITLDDEHPELGKEFMTKYFIFTEPGVVTWGYDGKGFRIDKITD